MYCTQLLIKFDYRSGRPFSRGQSLGLYPDPWQRTEDQSVQKEPTELQLEYVLTGYAKMSLATSRF